MIVQLRNAKTERGCIDILKLIFALFIVGLHTGVLNFLPEQVEWIITHMLFRLAVPFFICISGVFLGEKVELESDAGIAFKNYRRRLLPSFVFWTVVSEVIYFFQLLSKTNVGGALLRVARSTLFYQRGAMWYIASCIVASWIIEKLIFKKNSIILLWIISICGYLFALVCNTYYFAVEDTLCGNIVDVYLKIFESARNGLFIGVPYLWLGISLARMKLGKPSLRYAVPIFFISYGTLLIEVLFTYGKEIRDDSSLFFSLPFVIFALAIISYNIEIKRKLPFRAIRKLSVGIYYPHRTIENLLNTLIDKGVVLFVSTLSGAFIMHILCSTVWKDKKIRRLLYP